DGPPLCGWPIAAFGRWYCKGRYPLENPSGPRSSLILVYQNQLSIRGQGAVPAPGRSFGVIQTMLLVFVNVGLKRMGRENRQGRRPAVGGHRGRNAARTVLSRQKCRSYIARGTLNAEL